jgi:hypothetical protein
MVVWREMGRGKGKNDSGASSVSAERPRRRGEEKLVQARRLLCV